MTLDFIRELVSVSDFDKEVNRDTISVVKFFANWCGPCKQMNVPFEDAAKSFEGQTVRFFSLNIDNLGVVASKFSVRSIPCIICFKDGKVLSTEVGFRSKNELIDIVNKMLNL